MIPSARTRFGDGACAAATSERASCLATLTWRREYGEIIERSLVHSGLKHYFLVEFEQQPGALRRFLDDVLGPDDDITLFEYVKRNNRETGPALVGIELGTPSGLEPLLARMKASPMRIERISPGSPAYAYLT